MIPSFEQDPEGLQYFSRYLLSKGFHDIQTTSSFTAWDLEAIYLNRKYYFELKVRPKIALDGRYNDAICEQHKLESTPDIEHSFLVNLFTDCFTIHRYTDPHEIQHKMCQKTNDFGDRHKVAKKLCSYPIKKENIFFYESV